ncbi:MAG TPA: PEGA domain-containing protein [Polyangiaceae bacterium]|nr:PEGA domain-containing protein [Polyangiaceae bacterium]
MLKLEPFAWGSALALLVCLNGGVARAADDPDREARERYENAVKLYEDGAFDAALVELNRAAELRPSYKIFYNIGQVRFAMHDYAAAMDAYRQYLEKGGDKLPVARREQVQKELKALAQRVAKLSIETDVPGAEVLIDDVPVGSTPLSAPVVVNSGIRRIGVRHPDYLPQSRRVSIAGGVQDTLKFTLTDQGASAAGAPVAPAAAAASAPAPGAGPSTVTTRSVASPKDTAAPPATDSRAAEHRVPWLGWALTGVLATSAVVTGVITLSENSSLSDDRDNLAVPSSEVSSKASRVRTLATVTDGLTAAALITGGISLWLTLRPSERDATASTPQKSAWQSLKVGFGPSGISMKAAF